MRDAALHERDERASMERIFEPFAHEPEDGEFADAAWLGHGAIQASALLLARGDLDDAQKYAKMEETYFRIAPQAKPLMLQHTIDAVVD